MEKIIEHAIITHVIFDVDGTILDTEALYNTAKIKVIARYGAEEQFTRALRSKTAGKQAIDVAEIITEECDLPLTPDEFIAELDMVLKPILPTAQLKPGAERLIHHLADHNVPVAIATSSRRRTGKMKMSGHSDLFNLFSHKVFGSDDPEVGRGKPNPDIFLVAARRFEDPPSPENCLVFEDSTSGVQGALEAGMQVVMVPEHLIHPGATEVIDSFEEFDPVKYGLPGYDNDDNTFSNGY
eukprot:GFUD01037674.1.p1 GENE.GFUD01037674.1~~GFUD01037674.1.p1  ORF type:complete len:240 (+),score=74.88 GFUD01037674.1:222-941(+)